MSNTLNLGNGNWGVKKDSLLAYNSENGNFKPLPFNFTRAGSATRVNKQGLIEVVGSNEPRIDFKDNTKGALLLEPQRTNSFQQSNQFDTTWIVSLAGISVTPNQVGVGGSTDAWKLTEGTYNGEHFIRQTPNVGGVVSISVYAKAGTNDFVYFRGVFGGIARRTWFNLSNGTVGTSQGISAEMISMGDGWYRCVMILDHQTAFEYYIGTSKTDGVPSYQGNNGYIYIQNSQLEQGSYATSYIPTSGQANGVTRVAEVCNQTPPSNIIGQTEGTLFADIYLNLAGSNIGFYALQVYDNSFSPSYGKAVYLELYQGKVYGYVRNSTVQCEILSGIYADGQRLKMALAYKSNDFALYVNGVQIGIDTNGSLPSVLNDVSLHYSAGTQQASPLSQAKLYNTRLSNSELQALTTI